MCFTYEVLETFCSLPILAPKAKKRSPHPALPYNAAPGPPQSAEPVPSCGAAPMLSTVPRPWRQTRTVPRRFARASPRCQTPRHPVASHPYLALRQQAHTSHSAAPDSLCPAPLWSCPESQKQKIGPNCNFFAIADCHRTPKHGFQHENAANRPRNGPIPLCEDKRGIRNRKKVAKTLDFLFSRSTDQPNGRMSATNRSANETGPPIPCLQNQQKPTGPDQCWGKWEGFALLYEQPSQGKNNTK